jgi:hypothetical protein
MSSIKDKIKGILTPGSFKEDWAEMKTVDPAAYHLFTKGAKVEDQVLAKLTGAVGMEKLSQMHGKDADNPHRGVGHRALAGLAYLGGVAAGAWGGGSAGGGAGAAGGEAGAGSSAASGTKPDWMQLIGNQMPQQQQQQPEVVEPEPVRFEDEEPLYVRSSEKAKVPAGGMQAVARGVAGDDPIDANGVQISAIQALHKRLVAAKQRLAQLKGAN